MRHLWKVEFQIKYTGIGDWIDEDVRVISNCEGIKAITKARKIALRKQFVDANDCLRKAVACRLVGLEKGQEIDA